MAYPDYVYPIPNNLGQISERGVNLLTGCANLQIPLCAVNGSKLEYRLDAVYNSRSAALAPVANALGGYGCHEP